MSKERSKLSKDPLPMGKGRDDAISPRKSEYTSKEAQHANHIRIKNRRKMYLDRHPSYFDAPDLELAGLGTFPIILQHPTYIDVR
jgi:hypothetical protein